MRAPEKSNDVKARIATVRICSCPARSTSAGAGLAPTHNSRGRKFSINAAMPPE